MGAKHFYAQQNEDVTYCIRCAKNTAEVIEENEKQVTTLCGICGKIRARRKTSGQFETLLRPKREG